MSAFVDEKEWGALVQRNAQHMLRAMFRLPVDFGMADPARAAELLRRTGLE